MTKKEFKKASFATIEAKELPQLENKEALKDYIRNHELDQPENLDNLLNLLTILVEDNKVNGYGLNFVGRNFAKAKYAQKTDKELRLNRSLSVAEATTQNLVLKGDNLDSLKILKSHYSGKIKCIYIDPPYNTTSEEFVYPDKFDKEETEVLGLANLSEDDFARMDFSFRSKKSHNGWLAFMYPRLLLARDLLSKDGVIFISIDDNEQANLKLLCDEIFGEENFMADVVWQRTYAPISMKKYFSESHEFLLAYTKNLQSFKLNLLPRTEKQNNDYKNPDNDPRGVWKGGNLTVGPAVERQVYEITGPTGKTFFPPKGYCWRYTKERFDELRKDNRIWFGADGNNSPLPKLFLTEVQDGVTPMTLWTFQEVGHNQEATRELREIFEEAVFTNPKPLRYMKRILHLGTNPNDIILDFFAGSGTTGHAVMQLNAEDGGNRKFILCQIDEPIDKKKEAYKFCIENGLEPVISSITIERLRRAGEKIVESGKLKIENAGLFKDEEQKLPDVGFKVFDSVNAPKLEVEDGQIIFPAINDDALSRIYNMILTVGLDEPTQVPETVVENCIYKIGKHYYITNSEKINSDDFSSAIKKGKVFIDGWTASLNGTLQNYKEDVKIVF